MSILLRKLPMFLILAACWTLPTAGLAAGTLPVTASFSILGDLVRVVGGDRVAVTTLVGPDEDAHVFEPRPADAKAILQSRLLVINGLGYDPWAQKMASAAGYKGATLVASQGVKARLMPAQDGHGHAAGDPHAWQNPNNVVAYVRNISAALTKLDPAGASVFRKNSDAYVKELELLDNWARQQFAEVPRDKRKVITSHDAFGYFAEHYQVTFLAPQGVSTDSQASARDVAGLVRLIKREKIKAVFVENMGNPQLIGQLAKEAGVTVGARLYSDALSAAGKPGATYLQMMRHNVTQLTTGMKPD